MILKMQGVGCTYGDDLTGLVTAVQDINLNVEAGETLALVGHTGSGKSTLAQLMAGLLAADEGEIWLGDLCLTGKKLPKATEVCRRVGMVFQYPEHQLFAETVREELAYGPLNLAWPVDRIEREVAEMAAKMGLTELLDAAPYQLSGGEQRKVALASVLIMRPPLLILDEPFVGLDASARQEFMRLLLAWQQEFSAAIVCISHDMDCLAEFCKRLVVLRRGQMLLDAPIREGFDRVELLRECGIYAPLGRQAVQQLSAAGWEIDTSALTVDEAAVAIKAAQKARKAGDNHGR